MAEINDEGRNNLMAGVMEHARQLLQSRNLLAPGYMNKDDAPKFEASISITEEALLNSKGSMSDLWSQ